MIVPMKKVFLIVMSKMKRSALRKLGRLGVVHVETVPETSAEMEELHEEKEKLEKALAILPVEEDSTSGSSIAAAQIDEKVEQIVELDDRNHAIRDELEKMTREFDRYKKWGEFEPSDIAELREKGVHFGLYEIAPEHYDEFAPECTKFVISKSKTLVMFAAVTFGGQTLPEENRVRLPEMGIRHMEERIADLEQEKKHIDEQIAKLAVLRPHIQESIVDLQDKITFEHVHTSMEDIEEIAYLKGFVPEDSVEEVREASRENGWGVMFEDPADEDHVPTKVKNPKWVSIIQPIFDLLGTVPGYHEYDISFFFLFFLSIFFAMIIGDAGYGGILFIGALFGVIKGAASRKGVSRMTVLLMVFSLATLGWGMITGTWFGSNYIVENTFLSRLVILRMATFNPTSSELVKYICFIIGTVHISIAHLWNFISELRKKPRLRAFAQLGWFILVLGLFYLVLSLVLSGTKYPVPQYALYMMIAGIAMVILFAKQEGKFFKGILKGVGGLMTTFLDGIAAFSDIISYIRLFAVGLATVEIAKSFNEMASIGDKSGALGIIGGAIILIFGHGLNLAMGALSVVVHGVRLNMLEFSGHLGMEWTGRPYTPFTGTKERI